VLANEHKERLLKFVKTTRSGSGEPTPLAFYIDANKRKSEVFDLVTETMKGLVDREAARA
jgi:hypothetical protein